MKKILAALVCLFYPLLAFADSTLSFTPPSTDYSVIFLGNMFGVVDGVLHGTGSQIMGRMFGVFNAAVLALGGIVVTYTLIVGTMNTSHEGQFLGQKWSSIWIPVRSTIGLALLIPKASGYCLMQIFIMWVVVQGVGAADKIWNAALDYLNTGGVIMGAQSSVSPTSTGSTAVENIAKGESAILQGQVCMKGLQTILETTRDSLLNAKEAGSGACVEGKASANMAAFCSTTVPDFLSTVNMVEAGNLGRNSVPMPNFTDGSFYQQLNGICGTINWTKLDMASETEGLDYITTEDITTLNQSRPIAIQQMYMDLMPVANAMVSNDPQLKPNNTADTSKQYSPVAQNQYGIPYLGSTQSPCTGPSTDCTGWNAAQSGNTDVYIFSGMEFMNALSDYNAIMMPVLNLQSQADNAGLNNSYHEFIQGSEAQGWIMAGTYFFDLVQLNGSVQTHMNDVDNDSGLETSIAYKNATMMAPFNAPCSGLYSVLCEILGKNSGPLIALDNLITGASIESGLTPDVGSSNHEAVQTTGSATTYGYITNASLIHLPGQPGLNTPQFKLNFNMQMGDSSFKIPSMSFPCGPKIPFTKTCLTRTIADLLWTNILKNVVNVFITFISNL
ncbi:MAG TPA: type IVB secretion system protein DotA, partial [Legionellaceae bacterium]|nr:type IVB secretion system protein DotA [Legionellaceae bacterium]